MQLSHDPLRISASFDDPDLVSRGGLVPVMALAERAGLQALWLSIRDIEDKRARDRAREAGQRKHGKAAGRLIEGRPAQGWTQALNALAIAYPGRIPAGSELR